MADPIAPLVSTKKPWESKTILLNGVVGLVAFLSIFIPQAHVVTDWISSHGAVVGSIWSFANIALRMITSDKISLED